MIAIMDTNEHTVGGKLSKMLEAEEVGLVELFHKSWGVVLLNTYIIGKYPIDFGYTSSDVEMRNFYMLSFINSSGNHRARGIKLSVMSVIGKHPHKKDCPARKRLVISQPKGVNRYNKIAGK